MNNLDDLEKAWNEHFMLDIEDTENIDSELKNKEMNKKEAYTILEDYFSCIDKNDIITYLLNWFNTTDIEEFIEFIENEIFKNSKR